MTRAFRLSWYVTLNGRMKFSWTEALANGFFSITLKTERKILDLEAKYFNLSAYTNQKVFPR